MRIGGTVNNMMATMMISAPTTTPATMPMNSSFVIPRGEKGDDGGSGREGKNVKGGGRGSLCTGKKERLSRRNYKATE